jgi:hypothetical protein
MAEEAHAAEAEESESDESEEARWPAASALIGH